MVCSVVHTCGAGTPPPPAAAAAAAAQAAAAEEEEEEEAGECTAELTPPNGTGELAPLFVALRLLLRAEEDERVRPPPLRRLDRAW